MSKQDIQGKNLIYDTRSKILEMLDSRGYNINGYNSFTKDEVILQYEQQNSKFLVTSETGPLDILVDNGKGGKIFVKYRLDNKFKKSKSLDTQAEEIFSNILGKDDTLIILFVSRILSNNKDSNVYQYCETLFNKKKYFVQVFGLENFLFNPTKHAIVPKHIIIDEKEEEELLVKYNVKNKLLLPHILREDPVAKYIGIKPGQICKMLAISFSSMSTTRYRVCIN